MALTSDQITAQNFKEFYGQIRPYLNGNSPLAINTFNKSDIYSTDEIIIGRWIDGKPLYQKVINYTSAIPNNTTTTLSLSSLGITGQDNFFIISGFGYYNLSGTTPTLMTFPYFTVGGDMVTATALGDNLLISIKGTSYGLTGFRLIVQYTKNNDIQMSISDGNEYSTDEQIVGHWTDGKPMYQRTYTTTVPNAPSNGSYVYKNIAHNITNVDKFVDVRGTLTSNEFSSVLPFFTDGGNKTKFNINTTDISIANDCVYSNGRDLIFTVLYTKTTD